MHTLRLLTLSAALVPAIGMAQVGYPPADLSGVTSRLEAMETGPVAEFATVKANAAAGAAAVPYSRTKWAGSSLATDTTGSRVISIPPGKMSTGVACGITIRTTGAFATPTCVPVGSPAGGYTVTVTFTKLKTAVTIPAIVLGAAATVLPVLEPMASTGVVVFDIGFTEPDVVGP